MAKSELEESFALQVRALKLPAPEREYRFCERRWKFDFAWPEKRLAVEIEGAVWVGGRHTRGSGFIADMEKYNAAASMGWFVFRFDGGAVKRGDAIKFMSEYLKGRENV